MSQLMQAAHLFLWAVFSHMTALLSCMPSKPDMLGTHQCWLDHLACTALTFLDDVAQIRIGHARLSSACRQLA